MRWRLPLLLLLSLLISCRDQKRVTVTENGGLTGPEMEALRDTVIRLARQSCLPNLDTVGAIVIFVHPEVIFMEGTGPSVGPEKDTVWMRSTMLFVFTNDRWALSFSTGRRIDPTKRSCGPPQPSI